MQRVIYDDSFNEVLKEGTAWKVLQPPALPWAKWILSKLKTYKRSRNRNDDL